MICLRSLSNRYCGGTFAGPVQGAVQPAGLLQTANLADTDVASLLDIRGCESDGAIRIVEFLRAFARGPLRTECRKQTVDLVEVDAITTQIRTATGSILHAASGNDFGDNIGEFADAKVLVVAAYIESLVMYRFARCMEYGDNSRDDVADMDDGAPRRTV